MKHFSFLLALTLIIEGGFICVSAQQIRITPQGDDLFKKIIKGEFVSATDSTIIYTDKSGTERIVEPMFVYSVYINGMGTFKNVGGRFLSSSGLTINDVLSEQASEAAKKQAQEQQAQEEKLRNLPQTATLLQLQHQIDVLMQLQAQAAEKAQQQVYPSNGADYTLIGKAFKTTGIVSLSIGVPSLAAGIACCTTGHVLKSKSSGVDSILETLSTRSQCLEASYHLFGIGASLTIVGIPLYIQGKKIMEMDITYTGNSVGIALNL